MLSVFKIKFVSAFRLYNIFYLKGFWIINVTTETKCIEFRDNTNNKYALKVVNSTLRPAFEVSQVVSNECHKTRDMRHYAERLSSNNSAIWTYNH